MVVGRVARHRRCLGPGDPTRGLRPQGGLGGVSVSAAFQLQMLGFRFNYQKGRKASDPRSRLEDP